ncbi:hypothetical protein ACOMHN_055415 [Nucella lapillus]
MEKEAAVTLWNRSVQRHGLRYRTMLSDGDSTAFTAVRESQPYGPQRLVTKLECVNHCHKRMGTALRKAQTEGRLGGRGVGRLTKDKCSCLQNYYRGAILNNLGPGNQNAMCSSIWASLYHCCSTDDEPQHDYCPDISSWCFYKIAIARGEVPPPHAEHVGTAISSDVLQGIKPIYERMSGPALLRKLAHGKTQNNNESINNLIWNHCPKEVFVGQLRLKAAAAEAIAKFNRGNLCVAQVMDSMDLSISNTTVSALENMDKHRIQKAERAAQATASFGEFAACSVSVTLRGKKTRKDRLMEQEC